MAGALPAVVGASFISLWGKRLAYNCVASLVLPRPATIGEGHRKGTRFRTEQVETVSCPAAYRLQKKLG